MYQIGMKSVYMVPIKMGAQFDDLGWIFLIACISVSIKKLFRIRLYDDIIYADKQKIYLKKSGQRMQISLPAVFVLGIVLSFPAVFMRSTL